MEEQFALAKKHPLISDVAEEIEEVWKRYGCPEENEDSWGLPTGVHGSVPSWLEKDNTCFDGLSENEIDFLVQEYNNALEMLLELTGIWNAGGDTWHTYYYKSDIRQEYEEKAYDIALDFISYIMWDRFCSML